MLSLLSYSLGFQPLRTILAISPLLTVVLVVVYRLMLHPLAAIPGPKLAAATGLYESFFDCYKDGGGRYWVEIERLHRIYGPIVRINPWEVHIADSDWNAVYKYSSKAAKPRWFYLRFFGMFPSTNSAESHALHQQRRAPLSAYFASTNIQRYFPTTQAQVDKLCARLRSADGRVVSLSDAFRCLATDVATGFAFGKPFGHLDEPTFDHEFNLSVRTVVRASMLSRHTYGLALPLMHSIPESITMRMNPAFRRMMAGCVRRSMNKPESAAGSSPDMVQTVLESPLPAEEKTFMRLFSETRSVIMAGTETTASVLVCITACLLKDPNKVARLKHEIGEAEEQMGTTLSYSKLKELPYLTGVVNEGLRLANPTPSRLPRECPDQELKYKDWTIPRGTTISTTCQDVHNDPNIFERPEEFLPDRWAMPEKRKALNRYLIPWGRGTRLCLGMELATMDLYCTVARLFSPHVGFDMSLHNTTDEDWKAYHEWFACFPKGTGLDVMVRRPEPPRVTLPGRAGSESEFDRVTDVL
ncbi:cytochrome P450 CYP682H1 [Xylariales sp. AK1849]|nr:cytochrome P450 CYP682H1 [Xylariales sp. AK1849]